MASTKQTVHPALAQFEYQPLPCARKFRLIRLREELHPLTAAVQVDLIVADIDNAPLYNALSYAWVNPTPDSFVVSENVTIPVTANCQKALLRLRTQDGDRLLFVDAICINQSSTTEKNHQVAAMGDIYANARKVICWVGDPSYDASKLQVTQKVPLSECIYELCRTLHESGWVDRVWTVQEFALGKDVYIQCGELRLSYKDVYPMLALSTSYVVATNIPNIKNRFQMHELARSVFLKGTGTINTNKLPGGRNTEELDPTFVMSLMMATRTKQATEPRDRIFSLYTLFQRVGIPMSVPDYEKSLEDISFEATKALIDGGCSLNFLDNTCTAQPWTSWVPNPSKSVFERQIPGSLNGLDHDAETVTRDISARILHVRFAARVERITRVSVPYKRWNFPRLENTLVGLYDQSRGLMGAGIQSSPILEMMIGLHLKQFALFRDFLVGAADIWTDALFNRMHDDDKLYDFKCPPETQSLPRGLLRHLHCAVRKSTLEEDVTKEIPNFLWALIDGVCVDPSGKGIDDSRPSWRTEVLESSLGRDPHWKTLVFLDNLYPYMIWSPYDHLREAFNGSRAFVTSSGLCGFGTEDVDVDDLVVRIAGMSTLMVVRPAGNGAYRLVSSVDIDYDALSPDIKERWRAQGELFTIS